MGLQQCCCAGQRARKGNAPSGHVASNCCCTGCPEWSGQVVAPVSCTDRKRNINHLDLQDAGMTSLLKGVNGMEGKCLMLERYQGGEQTAQQQVVPAKQVHTMPLPAAVLQQCRCPLHGHLRKPGCTIHRLDPCVPSSRQHAMRNAANEISWPLEEVAISSPTKQHTRSLSYPVWF